MLTDALDLAQICGLDYSTGKAIPIYLKLTNLGIATPGQAVISLPLGTNILAPIPVEISEDEPALIWPFDLAVDEEALFKFWPRLPEELLPIEVQIQTGIDPNFKEYESLSLEIPVLAQAHLWDALNTLEALPNKDLHAEKALKYLKKAAELIDNEKVLKDLLKVTDYLQKSKMVEAPDVRVMVDHAIGRVEWMIFIQ